MSWKSDFIWFSGHEDIEVLQAGHLRLISRLRLVIIPGEWFIAITEYYQIGGINYFFSEISLLS